MTPGSSSPSSPPARHRRRSPRCGRAAHRSSPGSSGTAIPGSSGCTALLTPREQPPLEAAEHQRDAPVRRALPRPAPARAPAPVRVRAGRGPAPSSRSSGLRSATIVSARASGGRCRPRHWWSRHGLQQVPVLHPRRADRLAGPAAQAERRLLSAGGRSSGVEPPVSSARISVIRPRGEEPSSLGQRIGRAGGQAEPAGDAAVEQLRVEDRRRRGRRCRAPAAPRLLRSMAVMSPASRG